MALPTVSELLVRVNYSEVDQMGVVYHARYIVWLDMARTEHLRLAGTSYREVEESGYRLAVGELSVRFRRPARYDDLVRVRCWVREVASRRVTFGYAIEDSASGALLAWAQEMEVGQVFLSHLNNSMDYATLVADLPDWAAPAHDGLEIELR